MDRRHYSSSSVSSTISIQIDTSSIQNSNRLICVRPQYYLGIFHINALPFELNPPIPIFRRRRVKYGLVYGKLAGSLKCFVGFLEDTHMKFQIFANVGTQSVPSEGIHLRVKRPYSLKEVSC